MNDTDAAWAAGFLDGEGHITIRDGCPTIIVTQLDQRPLTKLSELFGGNIGFQDGGHIHRWAIYSDRVIKCCISIYPYMQLKNSHVETILEFSITDSIAGRQALEDSIRELNTKKPRLQAQMEILVQGVTKG